MLSRLVFGSISALSLTALVNAIPTITTKGTKFFTSDGNQFYVKGVAYQLLPTDPLLNTNQCQLDATLMQSLGANAIRVYHVDSTQDHSGCMSAFENAGIYLFVDLDNSVNGLNGGTDNSGMYQIDPHWNQTMEQSFRGVMDEFQKYQNTAGFFIGNEILDDASHSEAAIYIKAATRDLKAYRASKGYRNIPVGYAHADISPLRPNFQNYLTCGDTANDIEFFGLNAYEWCGNNSYDGSGYSALNAQVQNFPVPIFFSETGCIVPEPRLFQDQSAIFGSDMGGTWSGAIIYEWIQEDNHYGLITYGGGNTNALNYAAPAGGFSRSGTPTPITPDFSNLKSVWATLTPSGVREAVYSPSITPPPCPAETPGIWNINGNAPIPPVGQAAVQTSNGAGTSSLLKSTPVPPPVPPPIIVMPHSALNPSSISPSFIPTFSSAPASSSSDFSSLMSASQSPVSSGNTASATAASRTGSSIGIATSTITVATAASASASGTKGAAAGGKEITGMSLGLAGVLLGFVWWM